MSRVNRFVSVVAMLAAGVFGASSTARAQQSDGSPWSVDFAIGWDNDISGNINSSGIGTINNQAVVILKNSYEDVYGTGLHLRGGVGYLIGDTKTTELRASLSFQSLDADFVTPLGDIGVSKLYAQFSDYQALTLDLGARQYYELKPKLRGYADGTIGFGFIDKIDAKLVAPGANVITAANDFYDQTVAFSVGADAGLLFERSPKMGLFVQLGLRWTSGLAEVDDLVGTGLESINDKSSRWTIPFLAGVRYRF